MRKYNLNAYLIPSTDQHQSEYISYSQNHPRFISGFTGSYCVILVILTDEISEDPGSSVRGLLWTDGRYYTQADQQMSPRNSWKLMKGGSGGPDGTWYEWLVKNSPPNYMDSSTKWRVGFDPLLMSCNEWIQLASARLKSTNKFQYDLVPLKKNLIEIIRFGAKGWPENPMDSGDIASEERFIHKLDVKYAGQEASDKLLKLAKYTRNIELKSKGRAKTSFKPVGYLLSSLDEIAWILNVRGSAWVDCNPLFFSYLFVGCDFDPSKSGTIENTTDLTSLKSSAILFLDEIDPKTGCAVTGLSDVKKYLKQDLAVTCAKYEEVWGFLSKIKEFQDHDDWFVASGEQSHSGIYMSLNSNTESNDKKTDSQDLTYDSSLLSPLLEDSNLGLVNPEDEIATALKSYPPTLLSHLKRLAVFQSPIQYWKAIKNPTEIKGFKECHIRDGCALVMFFSWLENQIKQGAKITEYEAARKCEFFRSLMDWYKGPSFDTISSTGGNAAIVHYKPLEKECKVIEESKLYLCDSGGQYLDGTTDCTRCSWFRSGEELPENMRRAYTMVLKSHLNLTLANFPPNTTGYQLDTLTREPLWQEGMDYRHGTGHGVGHYLGVHEGPQGISFRKSSDRVALAEGMNISIEPGWYMEGEYGIRIENVAMVVPVSTKYKFGLPTQSPNGTDAQSPKRRKLEEKSSAYAPSYLGFDTLTVVPYGIKMIDTSLLSDEHIQFVNEYHEKCSQLVGKELDKLKQKNPSCESDIEVARNWLANETKPIRKRK